MRRLRPYAKNTAAFFALIAVSVGVIAVTEPLIPVLLKGLIDQGFGGQQLALWVAPVALIGLFGARGFFSFLAKYATSAMAQGIALRLSAAQFAVLHTAHPSLYTRHTASDLVNTMVYEVQLGATTVVQALLTSAKSILSIVALLAYLLYLNWQLTLLVFSVVPPIAWVIRRLSLRLQKLVKRGQAATADLAYVVEENVLSWKTIRLQGAQTGQQDRFVRQAQNLRSLAVKSTIAAAAVMPLTQILAAVAVSAVVTAALIQSQSAATSVGAFVAFITAMLLLLTPLRSLSEIAGQLTRGITAIERGLDLIDKTPSETSGSFRPTVTHRIAHSSQPSIEMQGVHLRFADAQREVLSDIRLSIPSGKTVAFVGSSGSGKTSLVHLLPRFLEPSVGAVKVYGVDIREWDVQALRDQFAFVSQDVTMLNDSLAANVALGDTIDEARVHAALKAAHLADWVSELSHGIQTPVGHNAGKLSGGQRQRLAIARALYKNAPILVLDEATSALDSQSEQTVKMALANLCEGRTTLIIAHRLSTIEHADNIIVLEGGKIVEQGSHSQLLANRSYYARLHQLSPESNPSL